MKMFYSTADAACEAVINAHEKRNYQRLRSTHMSVSTMPIKTICHHGQYYEQHLSYNEKNRPETTIQMLLFSDKGRVE